ncbi:MULTISPECIES: HesB/YadR/YfhF family protein [Bacillus]|uniref:HesB/YadR/YfhF family protein n=1 Tax=Bacillus TaxID=1386 RepID=UPI000BB6EE7B|nr:MULTISPECIES: HesB/YadR/YfhF family protein [Bacillus]
MKISISDEALNWYKEELLLQDGDSIRFQVRYGGCSTVQKGFSLGIEKQAPDNPVASVEKGGVTFYVEESEAWYFDGHDLHVGFNTTLHEPTFEYQ